jgi:diguanylate cyclase (GGDEF)-like protein/PAS domain S-box-containing protein
MDEFFRASSYEFSWFAVPVAGVGAANWLLGLLTLRRERGSRPSVTLLAMTFAIGVWLIGLAGANAAADATVGAAWVKISVVGTSFVPVCAFTHAALDSSHARRFRIFVVIGVALSTALAALGLSTAVYVDHVHHYYWGYYPVYGPAGPVVMAYYGVFFAAGGMLYRTGRQNTHSVTQRKRMMIRFAALAMALPATVDFLPTMHVGLYPFGYVFILGYVTLSTFTIWRYRLVDITPALAAKQITDHMTEGLLVVDRDGVVRVANGAAARVWSNWKTLAGVPFKELDLAWRNDTLARLIDPDHEDRLEVTFTAADDTPHTAIVSTSKLLDHLGEWVGTVYMLHDITERWQAEAAVRQSEERFRSLVQNASDLITVIDPDTTVRYQSPAIRRVLGFDAESALGGRLADVVHPEDRAQFLAALGDLMSRPGSVATGEGRVQDSNGDWRYLEFTGTDQREHPSILGIVLNVRDVTERRRLEDQLRHQALHDPLTQLGNRTRFADRLDHALTRGERSGESVAVLFLDLDDFKGINDSLGHSVGDGLLVQVAGRIKASVRPSDSVARLGGDEFAVLLEDISGENDATNTADRIFDALRETFRVEGEEIAVRASVGIATNCADRSCDAERLLRHADIAMYAAKAHGRACYRVFDESMYESMMERLDLLADLPRAVEHNQLVLRYQPIVLLRSGKLVGVEALVRWQHPVRGLIAPAEFIPLAEESGAILAIGSWVLNEACRQAAKWQAQFPANADWTVSVNVSVKQLQQPSFVDEVRNALRSAGLAPARLILEITESAMMHDAPAVLARLRQLKSLGIGLAIDDFGTGYASLGYLHEFPFDLLKIDKSFIDEVGDGVKRKEFAKAIIGLGKTLGLELVAEGIERAEQLSRLQALDCELGQGFYFAAPLESSGIEQLLAASSFRSDAA